MGGGPGESSEFTPDRTAPAIASAKLFRLKPSKQAFAITLGKRSGDTLTRVVRLANKKESATGATWVIDYQSLRKIYLRRGDGWIEILGEDEVGENVAVRYDPAIRWWPAEVEGRFSQGRSRMKVTGLSDGIFRDQGWCSYWISVDGLKKVAPRDGAIQIAGEPKAGLNRAGQTEPGPTKVRSGEPMDGFVVNFRREIRLGFARSDVVNTSVYLPGVGLVEDKVDQRTRIFGLVESHVTEAMSRQP